MEDLLKDIQQQSVCHEQTAGNVKLSSPSPTNTNRRCDQFANITRPCRCGSNKTAYDRLKQMCINGRVVQ
ncbi:unnamed protein product, partial [Rotaria magnacalcarata]